MALTRFRNHQLRDFDYKNSVRVATTTNIASISGGATNLVDGITLVKSDRILVKDQSTSSENGIYEVITVGTGSNGTWARSADAATNGLLTSGVSVFVSEGTANGSRIWLLTTPDPITLGTTALTFTDVTFIPSKVISISNTTVSTTATSGALVVSGGTGINGNIFANGTITGTQLISNIAIGTAPLVVTSTTQVANLNVAAAGSSTTAGTVTTAAQPNITSVGTLSSVATSGNVTVGNVLILSGNKINSSTAESIVLSGTDVTIRGNLTIQGTTTNIGTQDLVVEDSIINLHTTANLAALTSDDGRDIGMKMHYFKASDKHAFLGWDNSTSYLEYFSDATETSGTISGTYGTIKANTFISDVATGTAPLTVTSTTQVANLNVATAGSATTAGTVTTAAQPNITSVGTLSSLGVSGAVTASTLVSNVATGTAPFTVTSTTQVANLNVATAGTATSATTAGTVTTSAQPNITSVGTLTSLGVTGAVTASTLVSNVATGTAPLTVTSTTQVANLNVATAGTAGTVTTAAQPNITSVGNLTIANIDNIQIDGNTISSTNTNGNIDIGPNGTGIINFNKLLSVAAVGGDEGGEILLVKPITNTTIAGTGVRIDVYQNRLRFWEDGGTNRGAYIDLTAAGAGLGSNLLAGGGGTPSSIVNGTSNVSVAASGNVTVGVAGTANIAVFTSTGANITGTLDISGVTTASRFVSNIAIGTAPFTVTSTTQVANLNVATAGSATTAGTVTTAAQPNITSVGTLSSLGVTGAVTASTLVSNVAIGTAPFTVTSTTQVANLNVATAGSATTAGTVTTAAQPNITGVGTLTSLTTNGRIQVTLDGSADTGVTNNTTMLELLDNGATSTPSMAFHRPSVYATKIVLNTDNILYFGGWSAAVGGQSIATGTHLPGANATYALGSTSLRWSNIWGLASSAQYADLAEMYQADAEYSPATVMVFGGKKEITSSTITHDTAVAGVISTQPAYLMNDESDRSGIWLPLALTGRVPCRVKGPVKKGDVLVTSSTPGVAEKINNQSYVPGCVIGKSLEEYLGTNITTIEVVVGRF